MERPAPTNYNPQHPPRPLPGRSLPRQPSRPMGRLAPPPVEEGAGPGAGPANSRGAAMAARAALCLLGAGLALYALHVESAHARDPAYRAACDLGPAVSCTRVLGSRWGRGLGLVEPLLGRDSVANVPNGAIGLVFYLLQGMLGAVPGRGAAAVLLGTSVAAVAASLWLAGVLAFGLRDLCLLCLSTYLLNAALLAINCRRWRRLPRPKTA